MGIMRSRTSASDGSYRRPMVSQAGMVATGTPAPPQSHRPLSWHPSSLTDVMPAQQSSYHASSLGDYYTCDSAAVPVYSRQTSPCSTYLPASMSFPNDSRNLWESQAYYQHIFEPTNSFSAHINPAVCTEFPNAQYTPDNFPNNTDASMPPHYDWNQFAAHGFDIPTSPPTPDNFLPMQHQGTTFEVEDALPYHSLLDDEQGGEELIGLGLYDTPEKAAPLDPQLDNYRNLMMSQLMGPPPRKVEQTGKGLKLEETWNPPASDEGEDEEEDDDDDDDDDEVDDLQQMAEAGPLINAGMGCGNQGFMQAGKVTSNSNQPPFNGGVYGWL